MALRIAINGFGRIGRNILRSFFTKEKSNIDIVAINDIANYEINKHLLKYDSIHGKFKRNVNLYNNILYIDNTPIKMYKEKNPENIPWKEDKIDVVFECTGLFTKKKQAEKHLLSGVKYVIISAPSDNSDITIVYGINHLDLKKYHKIISNSSCTTNCLVPILKVLKDTIGIKKGFMTTIHSYTSDQSILDSAHNDFYRSRAANLSIIPTTTGVSKTVSLIFPEMKNNIDCISIRVPTPNVSLIDFNFISKRTTNSIEINNYIKLSASKELKGILGYTDEKLVSCDFIHDNRSSIVHLEKTKVLDGVLCRILSWYDNEWGFSNRMIDIAEYLQLLNNKN